MTPQGQILLAALLAGLVAIAVTVAIEKFGGLIGGILGTIPTTIVPAAAFMWLAEPTDAAFQPAMGMVPVGMLLNAIFLWLWRVVPSKVPDWTLANGWPPSPPSISAFGLRVQPSQ